MDNRGVYLYKPSTTGQLYLPDVGTFERGVEYVGSFTYVATDADVTAGYATIDVTANGYIVKIVLKQNEVASGSVAARFGCSGVLSCWALLSK